MGQAMAGRINFKLRVLDLFSGIGGFSLGLERSGGFETVAFCEIEPYCRRVLAKHWPRVPCYEDVRTLTADTLQRDGIAVDVICGGFPCQDISFAGERAGLEGARSGLWSEYARLIGELRPRFVIVENVPGLLSLGMGDVLGSLAALGYNATWDCVPASAVGAPHRRDRVWIVAHTKQGRCQSVPHGNSKPTHVGPSDAHVANSARCGWVQGYQDAGRHSTRTVAAQEWSGFTNGGWWETEPELDRVANGIPDWAHRVEALGNAVVPQIPEFIGKAIMQAEGMTE